MAGAPVGGRLTRGEISAAVTDLGWRYLLGEVRTWIRVESLAHGVDVAARVVAWCGGDADGSLSLEVRPDRVVVRLQARQLAAVTAAEVELARTISVRTRELGLRTDAEVGGDGHGSLQAIEIGIDALDIAAVRPFWQAVLGYVDEPGHPDVENALVDPLGAGPTVWFQQMDAPRPQRNRIHLDVSVPHDEAAARTEAALAAGGRLVSEAEAPAFRVLADPEGNEACVCTWQGRD